MFSNQPAVDLLTAYGVLFGSNLGMSAVVLQELQLEELKTAFRKKALATHPDRSMALGVSEAELRIRFQEVSRAYEVLKPYVSRNQGGGPPIRRSAPDSRNPAGKPKPQDHFFTGMLPRRKLKIGQFLYYSRIISWQTLIDAIVWQKKQRPLFGQIAVNWGYLTSEDVMQIISRKPHQDRFGEYATQNGYLTPFQQMAVAGKQRICQPLIGRHFIDKGVVSEPQMTVLHRAALAHNMQFLHRSRTGRL